MSPGFNIKGAKICTLIEVDEDLFYIMPKLFKKVWFYNFRTISIWDGVACISLFCPFFKNTKHDDAMFRYSGVPKKQKWRRQFVLPCLP